MQPTAAALEGRNHCMAHVEDYRRRGETALRSTAPIYRLDDRGRLDLFGTGVLVRHESQHFLVSAAHVLVELRERELTLGGESTAIPLVARRFFHTGRPGEIRFETDVFDVAFVPLSEGEVGALAGSVFVSTIEINTGPSLDERYCAVGFIAKDYGKVGSRHPTEVRATTLVAIPAPPQRYAERQVTRETHLLLSFDRLETYSGEGPAATPKILGMSGSGVWCVSEGLTSVLTEHHQRRGKVIVSTRLTSIIPGLASYLAGDLT